LSSNPKDIYFLAQRAKCAIALKEFARALEDALQIVSVNKHYRTGYILAVKCYVELKNAQSAEKLISLLQVRAFFFILELFDNDIEFLVEKDFKIFMALMTQCFWEPPIWGV
jgi:hypothetical protein